jgi:hypothetical protein
MRRRCAVGAGFKRSRLAGARLIGRMDGATVGDPLRYTARDFPRAEPVQVCPLALPSGPYC